MRLERLDLTRYGHFTDRTIDFGGQEEGRPDFHVIHGPNEAGKSTLFSAWLDLLYGIDSRTPYNFLHDYKTMRIGATLSTATGSRRLTRIKKPTASLLDENDQPLTDAMLAAELGGLDRDAYRTMFSLDETSLKQGGEAILESKGDLGQLLFSASAGLSDLARRLDGMRAETEAFHKFRAQKTMLADLKRRLDELKEARDAIDFVAADHARLVAERDRARALHDDVSRRRAEARVRMDRAGRRLAALPQLDRLESLRRELAELDRPPTPPAHWIGDIPAIRRREVELATEMGRLERDIAQIEAALAAGPERDPMLDRAGELDDLGGLAGRAISEEDDLPNRHAEREMANRQIARRLRRLGRDPASDPRQLLLSARTLGALKGLIAEHSGMVQRRDTALREMEAAEAARDQARDALARESGTAAEPAAEALATLAQQLAVVRAVDHPERLARAAQALEAARGQLTRRLPALAPWAGEFEALGRLTAPSGTVLANLARRLSEADAAVARASAEQDSLRTEIAGLDAERAAVAGMPGMVADDEASRSRAGRDAAWAIHRAQLDEETADLFWQALEADDRLAEQRLAQFADVARLRTLDQALARAEARRKVADEALQGQAEMRASIRAELASLISGVSPLLPADMRLVAFEAWCAALAEAQTAHDLVCRAESDHKGAADALNSSRARLSEAMKACGLEPGSDEALERMVEQARLVIDAGGRREGLAANCRDRQVALERRQTECAIADKAAAAWRQAWHDACAGNWLSERGEPPSTAEMAEILDVLRALEADLDARDGIVDRIGKMERDIAAFADAVTLLARQFDIDGDEPPRRLYLLLTRRLAVARAEDERRRLETERLRRLEGEHADFAAEKATLDGRVATMAAHFDVGTLVEVERKLALIVRADTLSREIESASRALMQSLGLGTATELQAELAQSDRVALETEIETLRPESDALDEEAARAYAAWSAARERLSALSSDDAVARLVEERRTVLLEIEDGARRYLELRLGAIATDQALRLYRDRHRSSMMTRASDAFVRIAPSYASLSTHRDGQRETLVAIGADGSSKEAGDLSKGTQFQLYLALRVAGYQEYAATRPPVPFIADDIMESFDETRSAEALTQLSTMARSGQVIYLTHHRHICDLATSVCPTVTLHTL